MYNPWYINNKDVMGREAYDGMQGLGKRARIKCFNCSNYGHYQNECPNPKPPLRCYLCSELGHDSSSCQLKLCVSCFKKAHDGNCQAPCISSGVTCDRCQREGHDKYICSERWRQFHNTTEKNERSCLISSQKKSEGRRPYCSNCASQGHFQFDCGGLDTTAKTYSMFITRYDNQDISATHIEWESLRGTKRTSNDSYIAKSKRSKLENQHSKVDSSATIDLHINSDRHFLQKAGDRPGCSGLMESIHFKTHDSLPKVKHHHSHHPSDLQQPATVAKPKSLQYSIDTIAKHSKLENQHSKVDSSTTIDLHTKGDKHFLQTASGHPGYSGLMESTGHFKTHDSPPKAKHHHSHHHSDLQLPATVAKPISLLHSSDSTCSKIKSDHSSDTSEMDRKAPHLFASYISAKSTNNTAPIRTSSSLLKSWF